MKTRVIAAVAIAATLSSSVTFTMAADQEPAVDEFLRAYEYAIEERGSHFHVPYPTNEECLAALPLLHAAIREGDARLKARSVRVLNWMYPLSDGSSDVLIAALQDEDARVREAAAIALGWFLPDAPAAVPHLEQALWDRAPSVGEKAAYSLGQLGPNGKPALRWLNYYADDGRHAFVRAAAVEAIVRIDPRSALERLGRDLESHVTEVRIAAAWSIRLIRDNDEALATLARQLIDIVCNDKSDLRLRDVAFETIGLRFQDHPHALDALTAALAADPVATIFALGAEPAEPVWRDCRYLPWKHHYVADLARRAVSAMQEWNLTPGEIHQLLEPVERLWENVDALGDSDELKMLMRGLLNSGISKARLAQWLAKHVEEGSRWAVYGLGQCGPEAIDQVGSLVEGLRRGTLSRGQVMSACVKIGDCSPDLIPGLFPTLTDLRPGSELEAAALAHAGEKGVELLMEILRSNPSEYLVMDVVQGLGAGGRHSAPAVPLLLSPRGVSPNVRRLARDSLVRLGEVAAPVLVEELFWGRSRAGWYLAKMGSRAAPWGDDVFTAWRKWATQEYRYTDRDALSESRDALIAIGASVVPALLSVCEDSSSPDHTRMLAAEVLAGMSASKLSPHLDALTDVSSRYPENAPLRQALAPALGDHPDHPIHRKKLLSLMRDPEYRVRSTACTVVRYRLDHGQCRETVGWCGDDVVSALAEAATMRTPSAFDALARMGPFAEAALPALLAIAEEPATSSESDFHLEALKPIAAIGPNKQGRKLILKMLLERPIGKYNYLAQSVVKPLRSEDAEALMRKLETFVTREERKGNPDCDRIEAAVAALSSLETRVTPPRSVAWLSSRIAAWVNSGYPDRSRDPESLLRELAAKKSARRLPAIRLAAMSAPREEMRSLARALLEGEVETTRHDGRSR